MDPFSCQLSEWNEFKKVLYFSQILWAPARAIFEKTNIEKYKNIDKYKKRAMHLHQPSWNDSPP